MVKYFMPVLVIVVSNIFYDVTAKLFPSDLNTQAGLVVVYIAGTIFSAAMFFVTTKGKRSLVKELKKAKWPLVLYAICSMGIDWGYILLFRADWNISFGSLVCNIFLAVSLLIIGLLFYKEKLKYQHFIGIVFCLGGLILINLQGEVSFGYFLPVIIIVVSNVFYDVAAKAVPEDLNTFAGLIITHSVLIIVNLVLFFASAENTSLGAEMAKVNWAVIFFAIAMVGLDGGYILLYREGWNISLGTLVCNITLATAMILIGITIFGEAISFQQIMGIVACLAGLILISYIEIRQKNGEEELPVTDNPDLEKKDHQD